jgi:hypothetical protein
MKAHRETYPAGAQFSFPNFRKSIAERPSGTEHFSYNQVN